MKNRRKMLTKMLNIIKEKMKYVVLIFIVLSGVFIGMLSFVSPLIVLFLVLFLILLPLVILPLLIYLIKRPEYCLYLFVFSLPFWEVLVFDIGFHLRFPYLTFLLLFFSVLINKRLHLRDIQKSDINYLLMLIIAVGILSSFNSFAIPPNKEVLLNALRNKPFIISITRVILLSFMVLIYFVTLGMITNERILKNVLRVLVLSSSLIAIYGLIAAILSFVHIRLTLWGHPAYVIDFAHVIRLQATLQEPTFFANFLLVTLTLLIILSLTKDTFVFADHNRVNLLLIILFVAFVLTFSRAGFIALAIATMIIMFILFGHPDFQDLRRTSVKYMIMGLILLLMFMVIISPFNQIVERMDTLFVSPITGIFDKSSHKYESTRQRLETMNAALSTYPTHPIIGIGMANYYFYDKAGRPEINNFPLKVLVETGLLGVLVWSILTVRIVYLLLKGTRRKRSHHLSLGLLFGFFAVSLQYLFMSSIFFPYLWVFLAIIVATGGLGEE
ncbi:O-antigen ligase family protein [Candidatus Peregrinibacteria bacterium]|nr:O-antigen ligase family protein [Candidatus Peregrinibacteria bacterium]